MKTISWNFQFI